MCRSTQLKQLHSTGFGMTPPNVAVWENQSAIDPGFRFVPFSGVPL